MIAWWWPRTNIYISFECIFHLDTSIAWWLILKGMRRRLHFKKMPMNLRTNSFDSFLCSRYPWLLISLTKQGLLIIIALLFLSLLMPNLRGIIYYPVQNDSVCFVSKLISIPHILLRFFFLLYFSFLNWWGISWVESF